MRHRARIQRLAERLSDPDDARPMIVFSAPGESPEDAEARVRRENPTLCGRPIRIVTFVRASRRPRLRTIDDSCE